MSFFERESLPLLFQHLLTNDNKQQQQVQQQQLMLMALIKQQLIIQQQQQQQKQTQDDLNAAQLLLSLSNKQQQQQKPLKPHPKFRAIQEVEHNEMNQQQQQPLFVKMNDGQLLPLADVVHLIPQKQHETSKHKLDDIESVSSPKLIKISNQYSSNESSNSSIDSAVSVVSVDQAVATCAPQSIVYNCIKKFIDLRNDLNKKRDESMETHFDIKLPKNYNDFTVFKKNYLIKSNKDVRQSISFVSLI